MELLRELIEINHDAEMAGLFEELGNLGKLELGTLVNAFKQTYRAYSKGRSGIMKDTSTVGGKFAPEQRGLGKDSETVEVGHIRNWVGLKKAYGNFKADRPLATIFVVDKKPVALLIASEYDMTSINDKVALAWDFSRIDVTEEEAASLTKGLSTKADSSRWRTEIVDVKAKPKSSEKTEVEKERDYDYKKGEYQEKFTTKKYVGFTQTVREIVPFVNNITKTFGTRLVIKLILADKVRDEKIRSRSNNRPIDPKEMKLFQDDIRVRLAKYKNSKEDSVESAEEFVKKVFSGALKKVKFAGSTFSLVPEREYMGSSSSRGKNQVFYNGTMRDLMTGKNVTMQFEADRREQDYQTLYLTVKMINGTLVPVQVRYTDKTKGPYGSATKVDF